MLFGNYEVVQKWRLELVVSAWRSGQSSFWVSYRESTRRKKAEVLSFNDLPINHQSIFEQLLYPKLLRKHYWYKNIFWSDGYFVCSIGEASPQTIRQYILSQGWTICRLHPIGCARPMGFTRHFINISSFLNLFVLIDYNFDFVQGTKNAV